MSAPMQRGENVSHVKSNEVKKNRKPRKSAVNRSGAGQSAAWRDVTPTFFRPAKSEEQTQQTETQASRKKEPFCGGARLGQTQRS